MNIKFLKCVGEFVLLWLACIFLPVWLGQMFLDARWYQLTEVAVSVYPGYLLYFMAVVTLGLVVRVPRERVLAWVLLIHLVVTGTLSMPDTFFVGVTTGIVALFYMGGISRRIIAIALQPG